MIFWLAGNFTLYKKPSLEKQTKEFVEEKYGSYNRLLSFYYKEDLPALINVLKPEDRPWNFSMEFTIEEKK